MPGFTHNICERVGMDHATIAVEAWAIQAGRGGRLFDMSYMFRDP